MTILDGGENTTENDYLVGAVNFRRCNKISRRQCSLARINLGRAVIAEVYKNAKDK